MDSPIKLKRVRSNHMQSPDLTIKFQICKSVNHGKSVFACGNVRELGIWNPLSALKLEWHEGNLWKGKVSISNDTSKLIEFKFIVSQWSISQKSSIEWQQGTNRTIDIKLAQYQSLYSTQWNRQMFTLCLRVHSKPQQNSLYYVTGSIIQLGLWKERKSMQPIELGYINRVVSLMKGEPESLNQPQVSSFKVFSFLAPRNIKSFNYYYSRWGETVELETFPGRNIQLDSKSTDQEGRIADIEYMAQRIIIDQSCFDQLVLQKMTNQIYLASCLKNAAQFYRITQKHSHYQSCSIGSSRVKYLCKENNVQYKQWIVQNLRSHQFIEQAKEIISIVQNLLIEGHKVCIHCSRTILKEGTIKILYLTLLGHSFKQAIQETSKELPVTQNSCRVAQSVLQLVSQKMNRGKSVIYIH